MTEPGISPAVRQFVATHIQSVEALEVLLLLFHKAERWWRAETVAAELGMSASSAEKRLEELASRRFLDARIAGAVLFRYGPVAAGLDAGVRQLADAYAQRRLAVINLVASKGIDEIRNFADAFRLKKKKEDADG